MGASGYIEVVVLVEGIEPTTSATLQARHSYLVGGADDKHLDLEWDAEFDTCCRVHRDTSKGLVLDLSRFHTLHPHMPVSLKQPDILAEGLVLNISRVHTLHPHMPVSLKQPGIPAEERSAHDVQTLSG